MHSAMYVPVNVRVSPPLSVPSLHEVLNAVNNIKSDKSALHYIYGLILRNTMGIREMYNDFFSYLKQLHKNDIPFKYGVSCLFYNGDDWKSFKTWYLGTFRQRVLVNMEYEAIHLLHSVSLKMGQSRR